MRRSDVSSICRIFGTEPDYSEPDYSSLFRILVDDFYKGKILSEKRKGVL